MCLRDGHPLSSALLSLPCPRDIFTRQIKLHQAQQQRAGEVPGQPGMGDGVSGRGLRVVTGAARSVFYHLLQVKLFFTKAFL